MLHYELDQLKGKTIDEAKKLKKFENYSFRVLEENGKALMVSTDMKKNRINVIINNKEIVNVVGIY